MVFDAEGYTPSHNVYSCQLPAQFPKSSYLQPPLFAKVWHSASPLSVALQSSNDDIAGLLNTVCEYYTTSDDRIASICYERTDEYFDMHVPGAEHYFAEGFWHHNTGKTYGGLYRLDTLARTYPDQYILARKVRVTMDSTVLGTWRRIIAMRGDVETFGGEHPQFYTYPNGARVWVVGFDNPDKILSGEFGAAYVNQAEELEEDDFETLTTRVTGRGVQNPDPMVFGDCNPSAEDHWIIGRRDSGRLVLLESKHEDNPTLYDDAGVLTPQGERTMQVLDGLTGTRYWRLRMGLWVGAEGQHFEAWNPDIHVIDPLPITGDWLIWGGFDYGYGHPLAMGVFGLAPSGDVHLMAEWGARKTLIPDHVAGYLAQLRKLGIAPARVRNIAAGHDAWATRGGDDAETIADKWARAVRAAVGHDALQLTRATVDRVNGATALQERLGNATRRPTFYVWKDCTETIKTIPRMVTDPRNPEDVKKINADAQGRGGDDYYDMARYGLMEAPRTITVSRAREKKVNVWGGI
jgi:hypothetical protein